MLMCPSWLTIWESFATPAVLRTSTPICTPLFLANWHPSKARANLVREALLAHVRRVRGDGLKKNIDAARALSYASLPLSNFLRIAVKETTLIPAESKAVVSQPSPTVHNTRKSLEYLFGGTESEKQPLATGKCIESIAVDSAIKSRIAPPPGDVVAKLMFDAGRLPNRFAP